ncbi:MAG: hypothetical protein KDD69_16595, partial [Bdellovibrionales bacterium]|nr:hypothetical protein [Bdellovibrionales bacterium]
MKFADVVVTGIGVESPGGRYDTEEQSLLPNIVQGRSGISQVPFSDDKLEFKVWGRCPWVTRESIRAVLPTDQRRMLRWFSRNTELAIAAGDAALKHSGILQQVEPQRFGVLTASDAQDLPLEAFLSVAKELADDEQFADANVIRAMSRNCGGSDWMIRTVPFNPAMALGALANASGLSLNFATACAASLVALGEAYWAIRTGRQDAILAGGVYGRLTPASIAGLLALREIVSPSGPPDMAPEAVCRPFDAGRNGIVLSEGAAFLVLESREHAERRGAQVLAELKGYGLTTAPGKIVEPDAKWFAEAISESLRWAGVARDSVGHVSAHATSTQLGDVAECEAIRAVIGSEVPVTSLKSTQGHLIIASGAMAAATEVLALQ